MIGIVILGIAIALLCGQLADMYMQLVQSREILAAVKPKKKQAKVRVPITCKDKVDWEKVLEATELRGRSAKKKTASTV